ncbi:helix-turn-helix domain-containing protein [Kitasatospora sp. NPDC054939]
MRDERDRCEPESITEVAAFMAGLRRLRVLSGLTYRELARRAELEGRVLPASTVAAALGREKLPRAELVEGFVRACGCPPDAVAAWLAARSRLACPPAPEAAVSTEAVPVPDRRVPVEEETAVRPRGTDLRRRAGLYIGAAGAATSVVLGLVLWIHPASTAGGVDHQRVAHPGGAAAGPVESVPVPEGKYRIRVAYSGLCLAERAGEGTGQVHQAECADAIPDYALEKFPDGTYEILSNHPEFGPGCMGVTEARTADLAQVTDDFCGRRGPAERFVLEPAGTTATAAGPGVVASGGDTPPTGALYRLRPRHSQKCLGFPLSATPGRHEWQPLLQLSCSPASERQLFAFEPVTGRG